MSIEERIAKLLQRIDAAHAELERLGYTPELDEPLTESELELEDPGVEQEPA